MCILNNFILKISLEVVLLLNVYISWHIKVDKFTYIFFWFGNNLQEENNNFDYSQTKKLERINFRVLG